MVCYTTLAFAGLFLRLTGASVLPRQVADVSAQLTADTGVTTSSAPIDVITNLLASLPPTSADDGSASLDEPEDVVAPIQTLIEVTPAVVAQQVSSGALDDVSKSSSDSSLTKRAAAVQCGLPALITGPNADYQGYFGTTPGASPSIGAAPDSVTSGSTAFYNEYKGADLGGSIIDSSYLTYKTLGSTLNPGSSFTGDKQQTASYVQACADFCASKTDCRSFNVFQQFGNPSYESPPNTATATYSYGVRCALYGMQFTGYNPVRDGSNKNINYGQWSKNCDTKNVQAAAPFAAVSQTTTGAPYARYVESAFSLLYSSGAGAVSCPTGYNTVFRPADDDLTSARQFTGAVNAATVSGNFLGASVLSVYSPSDCAAKCDAKSDCSFFDVYQTATGAGPDSFEDFGPSYPKKPQGVPAVLSSPQATCVLYKYTSSNSRRTNYGQYSAGNVNYSYISMSLGCAKPGSVVDPGETPVITYKEVQ